MAWSTAGAAATATLVVASVGRSSWRRGVVTAFVALFMTLLLLFAAPISTSIGANLAILRWRLAGRHRILSDLPPCVKLPTSGSWEHSAFKSFCRSNTNTKSWGKSDPHLLRSPSTLSALSLLALLKHKTLLLTGDSVMSQTWYGLMCALEQDGVVSMDVRENRELYSTLQARFEEKNISPLPERVREALKKAGGQGRYEEFGHWLAGESVWTVGGQYNVTILAPRLDWYSREYLSAWLDVADVAIVNFGLHYHHEDEYVAPLADAMDLLNTWANNNPNKIAMFREVSAQHFAWTGHFSYPLHSSRLLTDCEPLTSSTYQSNFIWWQNARIRESLLSSTNVSLLPYYKLTAPRYDMHHGPRGEGSGEYDTRVRDCTHFCYTPLFIDAHITDMCRALGKKTGSSRQ